MLIMNHTLHTDLEAAPLRPAIPTFVLAGALALGVHA
jgi:hypothetical protein